MVRASWRRRDLLGVRAQVSLGWPGLYRSFRSCGSANLSPLSKPNMAIELIHPRQEMGFHLEVVFADRL